MANEGSRLQGNDDYQDTDAHGKSRNVCIKIGVEYLLLFFMRIITKVSGKIEGLSDKTLNLYHMYLDDFFIWS